MSLRIHRAPRTDQLADGLGELLSRPLPDPFAEEVVVVPARGVERWLTQRLSHRLGAGDRGGDGVCAGVRFLTPHSLVTMLLGKERDDPWEPDRLVWPLLSVIDASLEEDWCATLAAHLGHGITGDEGELRANRRYSVARRLAGLFVSYAAQRPTLVGDWREGRDTDGCGNPVADDLAWQAELWRRLVDRVSATEGVAAPDVRHAVTVERLRAGELAGLELPPRLSLFGHTRLPATEVALLRALGEQRDVHLWLPQASQVLWDQLTELSAAGPVPRRLDRSVDLVSHPLLASLGRDARELQRTLLEGGGVDSAPMAATSQGDGAQCLLGWLQEDLRNNRVPEDAAREQRELGPEDRSIQVHACHGATRQIDVLREVLVGLLEDDPTLEPRDIVVMCPDVETYAPLISAGFGLAGVAEDGHPAHRLRVRLADRALSSTNPLLATAGSLVELAGSRVTATEVLDLAGTAAVRQRFGFTDDDLDQIALWVGQAGIRWGIDSHHRAGYGLTLGDNTWLAGMSRILLGVALAEDDHRHVGGTLPIDDVPSGDIDLAGRLIELVDRLNTFVRATERAGRVDEWMAALSAAVTQVAAVPADDAWQVAEFDRELARMGAAARDSAAAGDHEGARLRLADVRALLARRLGGRPTRANFRTGTLTVCTLVPMRSVPHRVVCLIGLDDGLFPRTTSIDGDDVLAREPLTGERDIRSEDRQLLLDAVMAAGETLVITYTGANEHTGAERPPAVPLGELLDSIDRTTSTPLRDRVVVRHPLQPFDQRNLVTPGLAGDRPFSFDRASLAGAEAVRRPRTTPGPLLAGPLHSRPTDDVALTDLHAFFGHPVRTFLRARLDVSAPLSHEETLDAIPIDLDALEKWAVGDRLLSDILAGADPVSGMTAEQLRGLLPPGELGRRTLREVVEKLRPVVEQALPLREGTPRSVDVDVDLGEGRRLTGTVDGIFGTRLVSVRYARLGARQRLEAWINLLAVSATRPDEHWTSHALGGSRAGASLALAGPVDHRATTWLRELVDLRDRGLREPLPFPLKTALTYAEESFRLRCGADAHPDERATKEWQTDHYNAWGIPGEDADVSHVRVFGEHPPYSLLAGPPAADEDWNDEPHRLGRIAWRVWGPLLEGAERVTAR